MELWYGTMDRFTIGFTFTLIDIEVYLGWLALGFVWHPNGRKPETI